MERVMLAAALVAAAVVVAVALERRRTAPPTQPRWSAPAQVDRADFDRPDAPWLVAVFTSATCDSCARTAAQAAVLAGPEVVVQEVEVTARSDLHRRYAIDAVPIAVIADVEGVVQASFVGPPSATDLWAAMAEARAPGSTPEPGVGRPPGPPAPPSSG